MEKIVLDNTNQELLLYVCNYFNNISGDFVTNYIQYIIIKISCNWLHKML